MNFHPIPKHSILASPKCHRHPADKVGLPIYKLILFRNGCYALMDCTGTIRTCDQRWAKKQAAFPIPWTWPNQ